MIRGVVDGQSINQMADALGLIASESITDWNGLRLIFTWSAMLIFIIL